MSKVLDEVKAVLKLRADRNGDQKVDIKDVEQIISAVKARAESIAEDQTKKHPLGVVIAVAVIALVVGYTIARLMPC